MGGVLVELGPLEEFLGAPLPAEEFWPAWLSSPTVRRFERGDCSPAEFGAGLARELDLTLTADQVVERFRGFPRGLFPGAAELVTSVVEPVRTGVLSNTNPLHWEHQIDAPILQQLFDHRFLSYELGLVKPDPAIFEKVVEELGVAPRDVVFVDDNQLNVDGARSVGLDAHLARGVDEARRILQEQELVAA
jgi:putative hydrolase of the HAD superfamily